MLQTKLSIKLFGFWHGWFQFNDMFYIVIDYWGHHCKGITIYNATVVNSQLMFLIYKYVFLAIAERLKTIEIALEKQYECIKNLILVHST